MTSSRAVRSGNDENASGNASLLRFRGPAVESTQRPRERNIESLQRGIRCGAGAVAPSSISTSAVFPPRGAGLINQYTISCPGGPATLNEAFVDGTEYFVPAEIRLFSPVASLGN